jgi:TM2 domain-containing membrane protein YozV
MHPQPGGFGQPPSELQRMGAEKKLVAGICGILLGGFGVHKFILGYTTEGLIMIGIMVATWVIAFITCGIGAFLVMIPSVIGLVEGILYLTKSDEEFAQTYIVNKKPWF